MTSAEAAKPDAPRLHWTEDGQARSARWHSERGAPPPRRVQVADDTLPADTAHRLACEGTALLWRGDFHNAVQLLQAIGRRVDRPPRRPRSAVAAANEAPGAAFHRHRQAQAQRARVLAALLLPLEADRSIPLRRAPDHRAALAEAWGPADGQPAVVALRDLQGLVGAHEWRLKGVPIAALGGRRIHPHHGVFSPVRGEYVDLVAQAPLPAAAAQGAFELGTGTGVLAAVLAVRGVRPIVATDLDARALACAQENLARLGLADAVQLLQADLYPEGRAGLVVCNPPWLPARAATPLERAVYDEDSRMLRGFLDGLRGHLVPGGEGWLILSDLAEHLGLRPRPQLLGWIDAAGLVVLGRLDTRPRHRKAGDPTDPLHAARSAEITSLWRLGVSA